MGPLDQELSRLNFGRRHVETVEESGIDVNAVAAVGATLKAVRWLRGSHDGQSVHGGERKVALVLARYGHDCAGPVGAEHVVGHVDRHLFTVKRIDHKTASEYSPLLDRKSVV